MHSPIGMTGVFEFIHASVLQLHEELQALGDRSGVPGTGLIVRHGSATSSIVELAQALGRARSTESKS